MAFTRKHSKENKLMLVYAMTLIDQTDTSPLNHRADKDAVLEAMAAQFPGVGDVRRRLLVNLAIMRLRAREARDNG